MDVVEKRAQRKKQKMDEFLEFIFENGLFSGVVFFAIALFVYITHEKLDADMLVIFGAASLISAGVAKAVINTRRFKEP